MNTEINKAALSKSVELSVRSRNQLANAIESAVMPLLIGTKIKTKSHTIERVKVYSDCQQCSGARITLGSEDTVLVDGELVCDCDTDFWDDRNWQYRCSPLRRAPATGPGLELASKGKLQSLAAELPEALVLWMTAQQNEATQLGAVTKDFTTAMSKVALS